MDRAAKYAASSQVILAVLGVVGALYLFRTILAPIAFALMLACILSPVANFFRRRFPLGPIGVLGFFLLLVCGGDLRRQPHRREPGPGRQHAAHATSSGSPARSAPGSPT